MQLTFRPLVGFAAFTTAVAFVLVAVATSQPAPTSLQASAKCPDAARELALPDGPAEAQRPA